MTVESHDGTQAPSQQGTKRGRPSEEEAADDEASAAPSPLKRARIEEADSASTQPEEEETASAPKIPANITDRFLKKFYPTGTAVIYKSHEWQIVSWNEDLKSVKLCRGRSEADVAIWYLQPKLDEAGATYLLFDDTTGSYFPGKFNRKYHSEKPGEGVRLEFTYLDTQENPTSFTVDFAPNVGLARRVIPFKSHVREVLEKHPSRVSTQTLSDPETGASYCFKGYRLDPTS